MLCRSMQAFLKHKAGSRYNFFLMGMATQEERVETKRGIGEVMFEIHLLNILKEVYL